MAIYIDSFPKHFSSRELVAVLACLLPFIYYMIVQQRKAAYNAIAFVALSDHAYRSADIARMQWLANYRAIIKKGLSTVHGVFRVETGDGGRIVVPSSFAEELRNRTELNFADTATDGAFGYLPGFQPAGMLIHNNLMQDTIKTKLTRSLDQMTPDLKAETAKSLEILLGDDFEWREMTLKPFTYHLIARISSRIFFGPEVADSHEWIDIAVPYTMDVFNAARVLRTYTPLVRSIVHWFIPECRRVRQARRRTKQIIMPKVQEFLKERAATGTADPKKGSMLVWAQEIAQEKGISVRAEDIMLNLTIAAIHSTTEMLSYCILDLIDQPDAIDRLREEIVSVLRNGGWKKTALSQMHLLDSVMKESQRLHPISRIMMERRIRSPVTLSSGFTLPQGCDMFVDTERHFSPQYYDSPEIFIPDRFLKMRTSEDAKSASRCHFVTTSPEHMGFGHGFQACPGRFFVGNEVKVVLIYLLLKYDWNYTERGRVPEGHSAQSTWVTMDQKVMYRRRDPEPGVGI